MMTRKTLATAACITLSSAAASFAVPVEVNFTLGDGSGTFYGLDDECGTCSATSFDFTTLTATFSSEIFVATYLNRFTFTGDGLLALARIDLRQIGFLSISGGAELTDMCVSTQDVNAILAATVGGIPGSGSFEVTGSDPLSPVPLPAGIVLLLSGLAGVTALKLRKSRAG